MKLALYLCLFSLTLTGCLSSPVDIPDEGPQTKVDITDIVNNFIQEKLDVLNETITLTTHAEIPILFSNVFNMTLIVDDVTLTGHKGLVVRNCTSTVNAAKFDIDMTFNFQILTIAAAHYNMDGMVVDTIHLVGDGTFRIIPEDLSIRLWGTAAAVLDPPSALFETISIDIEMWRWTVDFQGLMPGTDLGTVFNEFFTMVGPELMDLWEIKINEGDWLLDFVNGIFGPAAE